MPIRRAGSNMISAPPRHHCECDQHRSYACTSNSVSANPPRTLRLHAMPHSAVTLNSNGAIARRYFEHCQRQPFAGASNTIGATLQDHFECDPHRPREVCSNSADANPQQAPRVGSAPTLHSRFEHSRRLLHASAPHTTRANPRQVLRTDPRAHRQSLPGRCFADPSIAPHANPQRTLRTEAAMYLRAVACRSVSDTPHTVNANLPQALHADSAAPYAFGN